MQQTDYMSPPHWSFASFDYAAQFHVHNAAQPNRSIGLDHTTI